ncbi:MAG: Asp-tRNA(Asn)/Glu-tRNA(Gln) amidotransferase subunit GatB [Firmicutes bacterium]|nr:Asp-tRNA(Asn)/Glu-tRNA(Gln) amidotransferase subunit GatB [Bacillota bacterium]
MEYEVVMGLEVHIELATNSKLFCACSAKFGAGPNENVCPACAGMPGMLPVVNKRAIELGIIASSLLNCKVSDRVVFDKKNYFYPDLSTGYQLTQLAAPIGTNGSVQIETAAGKKTITIKQIHIEEDAGKLVHDPRTGSSMVDYNRASVPLIEIVSNPDFRNSDEVIAYLTKLQGLLTTAGVSDCKMQEGSMRCDVNLSVRKKGATEYGVRTEVKNMSSFKAIARAIAYEAERHIDAIEHKTEVLVQETRGWNDEDGFSFSMRSKENAADYRYFPYCDSLAVPVPAGWVEELKNAIPELPEEKMRQYLFRYNLPPGDSAILVGNKVLSGYFDKTVQVFDNEKIEVIRVFAREIANFILTDLLSFVKSEGLVLEKLIPKPQKLAHLIKLYKNNRISRVTGRAVFLEMLKSDVDIDRYLTENNLLQEADFSGLDAIIASLIDAHFPIAQEFKAGNEKVLQFFIGRIMKETKGKADPKAVKQKTEEALNGL